MEIVFTVCAILGGTVLVCQFVMSLLGLGHGFDDVSGHGDIGHDFGHDAPHDTSHDGGQHHGSSWFFGVLSFRTLTAALAFFGLAGLAALNSDVAWSGSLLIALAAGAAALYGVHGLMRGLASLRSEGTVRIDRAVGKTGVVYLKIPGQRAGVGKVHLNLQNRTVEYSALTEQAELPTGATIVVMAVAGPDTVLVESAAVAATQPNSRSQAG